MFSRQELAAHFSQLGVMPGDVVMLHASIRSVGSIAGGPDQIHLALKDALTPAGTLMMYTGTPDLYDDIGRGVLSPAEEAEALEKLPPFDPLTARCARDNGALVELFRTWPGTLVNPHIVRFAAWGAQARHLTSTQPWNYAYGHGSPLERFLQLNGKILLLGSDHDAVTFLHYAEHVAAIPDKIVVRYKVPIEHNGVRIWRDMEEFDTSERAHPNWPDRFFAMLTDGFLAKSNNPGNQVGHSTAILFPAREFLDYALTWMSAVAANPHAARHLAPR